MLVLRPLYYEMRVFDMKPFNVEQQDVWQSWDDTISNFSYLSDDSSFQELVWINFSCGSDDCLHIQCYDAEMVEWNVRSAGRDENFCVFS